MSEVKEKSSEASSGARNESTREPVRGRNLELARRVVDLGPALVLVLLFVAFVVSTPNFASVPNLRNVAVQMALPATVGLGQLVVILTRGIDLSVGSTVALCTVTGAIAFREGIPTIGVFAVILMTGLVVGLVNGTIIASGLVPTPIIVTLGMLYIASGLAFLASDGRSVVGMPEAVGTLGNSYIGEIPVPVLFLALVVLAFWILTAKLQFGRWLYAIGGSPEGARRAGIPVRSVVIGAYMLSGLAAALGAILVAGRTNSGYPTAGNLLELETIAAVVIGGASVLGGRGNVWSVLIGAATLAVVNNGLNLLNVSSFWQLTVTGTILILAVALAGQRFRLIQRIRLREADHSV